MKQTLKCLNDEHMQLYEWNGLGALAADPLQAHSKRSHGWHASYSVLAVLTSLLILNGCDRQTAAEQASEQVGQAVEQTPAQPLYDDSGAQPAPAEAGAPAAEGMSEPTAPGVSEPAAAGTSEPATENAGQTDEALQQP